MANHPNRNAGPFVVIIKREYYGPRTERTLAQGRTGEVVQTHNRAAAQDWIEQEDSGRYYLAHNESCRPTYTVRPVSGLPAYLAACIA